MTLLQRAEEIQLTSGDLSDGDPAPDVFDKITAELVQIQRWKSSGIRAQLLDNKFLYVRQHRNGREIKYWINLLFANPVSKREIHWDGGGGSLQFRYLPLRPFCIWRKIVSPRSPN